MLTNADLRYLLFTYDKTVVLLFFKTRLKRSFVSYSPDLESYGKSATFSKSRLSVDAMLEATSLCYDNASYDTPLKNSLPVQQI